MRRQRGERGAAMVEFALVVPLLLLIVMGIAEFGRAYSIQTNLSGAAREGVRSMALHNIPADAQAVTKAYAPTLNLTNAQIAVTVVNAAGATVTSCAADATTTVTISYPMTFISGWFGNSITLKGRGVMRCNG